MPDKLRFPPTVEIKRVIAAVLRAGIRIASIEIQPRKITIHPSDEKKPEISAYALWKMTEGKDTSRVRHAVGKTDAPAKKPRS